MEEINKRVIPQGGEHVTVHHSIEYNNGHDNNLVSVDFYGDEIIGASYKFGGVSSFGGGKMKVEELRRFKALLNSFPEL